MSLNTLLVTVYTTSSHRTKFNYGLQIQTMAICICSHLGDLTQDGFIQPTERFQTFWYKTWTKCSENDNTPQPLDLWTNSPFMGRQVGNCKSFTLTHYLADLFAMHCGPTSIPLCIQHHIHLTSLSFQVSRPSHSWDTAISIFYLENPRSRSSVRSKFKVTTWVQHPID